FANRITTPEPKNLLDPIIFFDFRNIYGDEKFTDGLRKTIGNLINEHSMFLYHLAYNTYNTKSQQVSSGNIISDKNTESVDLKNAVNPIIMFARTYSLQNNICCTNTLERLYALKVKRIINESTAKLIDIELSILKKTLSLIPAYQNKLSVDFRITI
ncbi:MAG: hypothetical protein NTU73_05170, partial [Ignavibacteriae bacterium]|nr:hypothetical protein [Ignavibacteriota bacterium]